MITHKYIKDLLSSYTPLDETEGNFVLEFEAFLDAHEDVTTRDNTAGHITASGFVVRQDRAQILLVHHKKISQWFQPGGHLEPEDQSLQQAAAREVLEETGLTLSPSEDAIFDIDIHSIPEHKGVEEHKHYDIRFLFITNIKDFIVSDESHDVKWINIEEMGNYNNSEAMRRVIKKIRSL